MSLRFLLSVACLLCLTQSAFAQNYTASTPMANLTLIKQAQNNFSSNVATPSYPCDSTSPGRVGGYSQLDLDDAQSFEDVSYVAQAVFNYYLYATANLTDCKLPGDAEVNISSACSQVLPWTLAPSFTLNTVSLVKCAKPHFAKLHFAKLSLLIQVVSGTNYALEFEVVFDCLGSDNSSFIAASSYLPLRSRVYLPIQDAAFDTYEAIYDGPQIKDLWFFMDPEVVATNISAEAEAEAPAAEAELTPPASSSSPASGDTTTTNLLTGSSGVGSSTGTLQFTASPSAEASPSTSAAPKPEVVTGFDSAAQDQSIMSG